MSWKVLFLDYEKIFDSQIFHLCTKLIASDLNINETFKSMHQSIITKIQNYAWEDRIVLDTVTRHSIKIFGY